MASHYLNLVSIAKSLSQFVCLSSSQFALLSMYLLCLVKCPHQRLCNGNNHGVFAEGRNTLLLEPFTLPFS